MYFVILFCLFIAFPRINSVAESVCSKFDYEDRLLSKMVRMEFEVEKMLNESKETVADLRNEMAAMRIERDEMQATLTRYGLNQTSALAGLERFTNNMDRRMDTFQNVTNTKLQDVPKTPMVLFEAHNPMDKSPSSGQTYIFQTTSLNEGEGYDGGTGIFTAPVAGAYTFSLQVCMSTSIAVSYAIVKENVVIMPGYYYESDSNQCTTAVAYATLKFGDNVWIRCISGSTTTQLINSGNTYWTSFSGALIHI